MVGANKKKGAKPKTKVKKVPKQNPFELKFNKLKFNVLGKKIGKHEHGNISVNRKKAYETREETLGVEMKTFRKANKLIDKRVGQKDLNKTEEEKDSMRFAMERMRNFKEASKYNLADDEEMTLTHGGSALTDIQRYDRVARDEDDEDAGYLAADLVRDAHFGGGEENAHRSRKDAVNELIAKTKQSRQEKLLAKDELEALTESVDQKFKNLLSKVSGSFRTNTKNDPKDDDDYDKLAFSLKTEADNRATPSNRLKNENELAAEEVDRLKQMEKERLARQNGSNTKNTHLSADMDIKGLTEPIKKKKGDFEVKFDMKGSLMNEDKVQRASIKKVALDSDDELSEDEDEDEEEMEELDDMINDGEEGESGEEEVALDSDDVLSGEEDEDGEDGSESGEMSVDGNDNEAVDKALYDSIPFVFEMPKNYKEYVELLKAYSSPAEIKLVHERLIKCHHPGLKQGNKKLLSKLFLFVLRYFDDMAVKKRVESKRVTLIGMLIPILFKLMKYDLEYSVRCIRAMINQHWRMRREKDKGGAPSFGVIALMRLVSALYPMSDKWHPACTPALLLASVTISSAMITSLSVLARQVLLVTFMGDAVEESKRIFPEAMAFLHGALLMAVDHSDDPIRFHSNVFPVSQPHTQMLHVSEALDKNTEVTRLTLEEIYDDNNLLEDSNLNKCRVLRTVIGALQKFRLLYAIHEHSFTALFSPFVALLKRIPNDNLPTSVSEEIEMLIRSMEAECKSRSRLTQLSQVKTEKSMLQMLEPMYEWSFDPERPKREQRLGENSKLQHVYKREMRGAMKELRKDAVYIGRKQKHDIMERDKDRREKTKRLMHGLDTQQAEWRQEKYENGPKRKRK
ncbi:unnamed protein product [Auanema sp. JU1783]|nr:unnamed protein product [Auanema sp. JU1783]